MINGIYPGDHIFAVYSVNYCYWKAKQKNKKRGDKRILAATSGKGREEVNLEGQIFKMANQCPHPEQHSVALQNQEVC